MMAILNVLLEYPGIVMTVLLEYNYSDDCSIRTK